MRQDKEDNDYSQGIVVHTLCARAVRAAKRSNARKSRAFYFCDWCKSTKLDYDVSLAAIPNGLFRRGVARARGEQRPPLNN